MQDVWLYSHWQILAWLRALPMLANADVRALAQDLEEQNHKYMQQEHCKCTNKSVRLLYIKKRNWAWIGKQWEHMMEKKGRPSAQVCKGFFLTPWNNAPAGSIQHPPISKTYNWGAGKSSVIFTQYCKSLGFYALFAEHNLPTNKAFFPILVGKFPKHSEETSFW